MAPSSTVQDLYHQGDRYRYGTQNTPRDPERAFQCYQKASGVIPAADRALGQLLYVGQGTPQNKPLAVYHFQLAAAHNDPVGQIALAQCYIDGDVVGKGPKDATPLLESVSAANAPHAHFLLAVSLWRGLGCAVDKARAYKLFFAAAEAGHLSALINIAQIRTAVPKPTDDDLVLATGVYRYAAEIGHPRGHYNLAVCLLNGEGVAKDRAKAVEHLEKAAEFGDDDARVALGAMLANGTFLQRDVAKAVKMLAAPANNGNIEALYELGTVLVRADKGSREERKKGAKMLLAAADGGHAEAMCKLAHYYLTVAGEDDDVAAGSDERDENAMAELRDRKAIACYEMAAQMGYAKAQYNLALCLDKGRGVARNRSRAFLMFQSAARGGFDRAQCRVGLCYEKGWGVVRNPAKALRAYLEAAQQGLTEAQVNAGGCFERGVGAAPDTKLAEMWFRKAAEQGDRKGMTRLGQSLLDRSRGLAGQREGLYWVQMAAKAGDQVAIRTLSTLSKQGVNVK